MTRRFIVSLFLLLLLFSMQSINSTFCEEECSNCKGTGKIADTKCPTQCPYLFCTYCFDEFPSHGFGFLVCPKCNGAQAEWDGLVESHNKWLEKRRERIDKWVYGDDFKKMKIGHAESEHFIVGGTLRDSTVYINNKPLKYKARERAHLFLERAEKCYVDCFLPSFGLSSYKPQEKWDMTFWSGSGEILKASNRLVGISQAGVSTFQARLLTIEDVGDDKVLHQAVIFNLALLWVEEYDGFVLGGLPDWVWEGFAHYVEYSTFGSVENNCNDEALGTEGLRGKNLENRVKQMVKKGNYPKITEFGELNVSKLTPEARLEAWSIIDWFVKEHKPKKFELFIKLLKRTKSQPQAFRDSVGLKWDEVSAEWAKWALSAY